jgi:hypothetical protein
LWAITRVSRTAPENNNGPDNFWLPVEAGGIPLHILYPDTSQQLHANLQADHNGWQLQVTDAQDKPVNPTWGYMEATTTDSTLTFHLASSTGSHWQGGWDDYFKNKNAAIAMRVWIASPGHVTLGVTKTLPGEGDPARLFQPFAPELETFGSLDQAQTALRSPLLRPHALPNGTTLESIQMEITRYDAQSSTKTAQLYRLSDNYWLELTQKNDTEQYESAGWGEARYAPDAKQVKIAGTMGYLIPRLGWWALDWKVGDVGLELHAPIELFSQEQLSSLAESVQP